MVEVDCLNVIKLLEGTGPALSESHDDNSQLVRRFGISSIEHVLRLLNKLVSLAFFQSLNVILSSNFFSF